MCVPWWFEKRLCLMEPHCVPVSRDQVTRRVGASSDLSTHCCSDVLTFFPPRAKSFVSDSEVLKKRDPLSSSGSGADRSNLPRDLAGVRVCIRSWVSTCPADCCCSSERHIEIHGGRRGLGLPWPRQSQGPWVLWWPQPQFTMVKSLSSLRPATVFSELCNSKDLLVLKN